MICPNKNTKEWKNLVKIQGESEAYLLWTAYQGNVPEQFYSRTKPVTTTQTTIKPGVAELFESNPELANSVYSTLGFESSKNKLLSNLKTKPLHEALNITNVSNAKEIVDALIKFKTKAGFEKILNLFDENELKNIKVKISGNDTASYQQATNTIFIHPEYFNRAEIGDFYTTIIHELIHHKFRGADIASGLNILYGITNIKNTIKQLPVHNKYRELYILVKNGTNKTKNDYYGLSSVDEFISEGYSNPEFQAFLKTVTIGKKSALDKIVDLILSILTLNIQRVFSNKFNSNNAFDIFSNIDIQSNNILIDFNNHIQNYQKITPEQKQQAQQLYSQYLDTIFPDSKVKDIVYHGSSYGKKENFNANIELPYGDRHRVIFFATNINQSLAFSDYDKSKITSALINVKNPFGYNYFSSELKQDLVDAEYKRIIEVLGEKEVDYANKESQKFPDKFKTKNWDLFTGRKFLSKIYKKYNIDSWFEIQGNVDGVPYENIAVFEPDQIHILGSKQDIEGFKESVQGKQFQKLTAEEKAKTIEQVTKEHRSITALKDLSAKLAYRIGGKVQFENNPNADWKGYNQGMKSVLNEAYMTPDTPFHEILAHPIIRAIKNNQETQHNLYRTNDDRFVLIKKDKSKIFFNTEREAKDYIKNNNNSTLYQNLLKELETGRGKEVFEQVKKDYVYKNNRTNFRINKAKDFHGVELFKVYSDIGEEASFYTEKEALDRIEFLKNLERPKYTLEEQQEEAIVTLLGMMAADKLDAKKDATLISKLKELWKQISDFVKSLLRQDGIKIDELPITTTLNDLAEILGYGNNKIILPGYKVEYSTPLGNKYDTLEEVNNEIRGLADADIEVDLSDVKLNKEIKGNYYNLKLNEPYYYGDSDFVVYKDGDILKGIDDEAKRLYPKLENKKYYKFSLNRAKWESEFTEIKGEELKTKLTQNNLAGIYAADDIKDANFTDIEINNFIEKNKEYEQSKEIIEQWKKENNIKYDPEEVYSRGQGFYSTIGAYSNLELDLLLKNLIQHIEDNKKAGGEFTISAFTKPIDKRIKHLEGTGDRVRFVIYPQSEHIKWAAPTDVYSGSVWDASEKVSKDKKSELLGVSFTKAPSLRNINEVSPNLADIIDNLSHAHNELGIELTTNNFRIEYDDNIDYSTKKLIDNINKILDDKYGKLEKPDLSKKILKSENLYVVRWKHNGNLIIRTTDLQKAKDTVDENSELIKVNPIQQIGKQPTQTRENTTSIESVKSKLANDLGVGAYKAVFKNGNWVITDNNDIIISKEEDYLEPYIFDTKEDALEYINKGKNKEYTNQALINLKIAALKEVARKYPRSLITSKVVPINPNMVDNSEIQYSKVGSEQDIEGFKEFINKTTENQIKNNSIFADNTEYSDEYIKMCK